MRTRKVLNQTATLIFGLLIWTGCLKSSPSNRINDLPFTIQYNNAENKYFIQTPVFNLYDSKINENTPIEEGTCGSGDFIIEFDEYLLPGYYNAELIGWDEIPTYPFTIEERTAKIQDSIAELTNYATIGETLFFQFEQAVAENAECSYNLNYNPLGEKKDGAFIFDLEVKNNKIQEIEIQTETQQKKITFDIAPFLQNYGEPNDTIEIKISYYKGLQNAITQFDTLALTPFVITPTL